MADLLFQRPDDEQVRRDCLRRMLHRRGYLLGYGENQVAYIVLDGMVWADVSTTQVVLVGDYFEFCEGVREGRTRLWKQPIPYPE